MSPVIRVYGKTAGYLSFLYSILALIGSLYFLYGGIIVSKGDITTTCIGGGLILLALFEFWKARKILIK